MWHPFLGNELVDRERMSLAEESVGGSRKDVASFAEQSIGGS